MNNRKIALFLEEVIIVLTQLENEWFPANKKTDSGYYYACSYCDCMNHNQENHDTNCLIQIAKNTLFQLNKISLSNEFDSDWKNNPRTIQEINEIKQYKKHQVILEMIFKDISRIIPLDYSDPSNEGIICSCKIVSGTPNHTDRCPYVRLSQALANLLTL